MNDATIPAQPGYYLLNVMFKDDGTPYKFDKTPIIAWRVIHGTPYPIGDAHALMDAVMRPDESVYIPSDRFGEGKQFKSEAEALQHFTDEYRRHVPST